MTVGNKENYNDLVANGTVLVDFFATWCGPCKMLSPILEEVESDRDDISVVKIDVDQNEELAKNFGIMSVPTIILYKDGKLIEQRSGYMPKNELIEWINNSN